jgi:hypothetical protein
MTMDTNRGKALRIVMANQSGINSNEKCTCRWLKCKRHGKCDECIAHHINHKKYPQPFCMRNPAKRKINKEKQGDNK